MTKEKKTKKKKEKTHTFVAWGYSDDCSGITGAVGRRGQELSKYDGGHVWFEFKVNGEVIGKYRMIYRSGWEFEIKSEKKISAGKALEPTGDEDYEEAYEEE